MKTLVEKSETKTSATRLLDLLHGWKNYVVSENDAYPDTLSPDELAETYQEAGAVVFRDFPDTDAERAAVCQFVIEKVLPLILK